MSFKINAAFENTLYHKKRSRLIEISGTNYPTHPTPTQQVAITALWDAIGFNRQGVLKGIQFSSSIDQGAVVDCDFSYLTSTPWAGHDYKIYGNNRIALFSVRLYKKTTTAPFLYEFIPMIDSHVLGEMQPTVINDTLGVNENQLSLQLYPTRLQNTACNYRLVALFDYE